MFEFIRKRLGKKTGDDGPHATATTQTENSIDVSIPAKQIALIQADEMAGDEPAAVEFILRCQFSDARLAAAAHVHSRPMVERVLGAMRNTDRRVVKLMQKRLDICNQWEANEQLANRCIANARQLAQARHLMPNQVADLDKQWQAIHQAPPPLQQTFAAARMQLQQRLSEQVRLQRAVHDALAQLRDWSANADFLADANACQQLTALEQQVSGHGADPEAASLPKNLLADFQHQMQTCRNLLEETRRSRMAIDACNAQLAQWEAADPADLDYAELTRTWNRLPVLPQALAAPLQVRFDELAARVRKSVQVQKTPVPIAEVDAQKHFDSALAGLDEALKNGALQVAAEHNKALQALNMAQLRPHASQLTTLSRLRAELSRLQGWARWGGNVSREELLHAAQSLIAHPLPPTELAGKVGSLREHWKALDVSAGPAPRELWLRFDEACSTAYAPAAAHFRQLAEEREQHALQAQALIDECIAYASRAFDTEPGGQIQWKEIAAFLDRMRQAWRRIGAMDRKEKKRLDGAFDEALRRLAAPLGEARDREVELRQQLIAQAAAIEPHARNAVDELRALQAQWQHQAKALPLERKQEQDLWRQFRARCDRVFAARKETSVAADAERRAYLQRKEALCERLEAAQSASIETIRVVLRESKTEWEQIGPVPRTSEQRMMQRYQQAIDALQRRLQQAGREQQAAAIANLQAKLRLCQTVEQRFISAQEHLTDALAAFQTQWDGLPQVQPEYEQALQARFAAVMQAARNQDQSYAASLSDNRPALLHELLRLEIVSGLESPPTQARERLQLQVSVLRDSLKSGQQSARLNQGLELLEVCRLPALLDPETSQRLDRILESYQ